MRRITVPGKKHPNDLKFGLKCDCGRIHFHTFADLAWFVTNLMNNEDTLFPPSQGLRGGEMLGDYMKEAIKTRQVPSNEDWLLKP